MVALLVKVSVIPYIANIIELEECWTLLKNLYACKTNIRKFMLRRRLTNLKLEEDASMSLFLQGPKEILNEFAFIGEIIPHSEVVEQVLIELSESFEGLVKHSDVSPILTYSFRANFYSLAG